MKAVATIINIILILTGLHHRLTFRPLGLLRDLGVQMKVKLQVALDLIDLNQALIIGREALEGGADIVEAGTPLIKKFGMEAVKALRSAFPDVTIVADMKTMDAGALEAEMALIAGADIVTVMALAPEETIIEALDKARELGGKVMVDLMNVTDVRNVALRMKELRADYLCLHVGIDVQKRRGVSPEQLCREISEVSSILPNRVAVAGGIKAETAPKYAKAGASIIIVGGAITRSSNPREATKRIKEAIRRALR